VRECPWIPVPGKGKTILEQCSPVNAILITQFFISAAI
jgi:hypothetical protein